MSDIQIIRPSELKTILNVSLQTIYRLEKRGELPNRIKISQRAAGWLKSDIQAFLESKREPKNEAV